VKNTHCDFSAVIGKVGINPCVEIPATVSACLGGSVYIPVSGTLNGFPIRATLVPVGGGRHRLYINGDMRKQAHVAVGDTIHLVLEFDRQPRPSPMPKQLAVALRENEKARRAFEELPPSRQREILVYLNYLKKPETVQRNVQKVIKFLVDEKKTHAPNSVSGQRPPFSKWHAGR